MHISLCESCKSPPNLPTTRNADSKLQLLEVMSRTSPPEFDERAEVVLTKFKYFRAALLRFYFCFVGRSMLSGSPTNVDLLYNFPSPRSEEQQRSAKKNLAASGKFALMTYRSSHFLISLVCCSRRVYFRKCSTATAVALPWHKPSGDCLRWKQHAYCSKLMILTAKQLISDF